MTTRNFSETTFSINPNTVLLVIFAILFIGKLAGWFSIGWLWVFSPFWLPVAAVCGLIALIVFALVAVALVALGISIWDERKG